MIISLVVCTYNRVDILSLTLPSVLSLTMPEGIEIELIIVDNNSKDNTAKFSKDFIKKNNDSLQMHYLFERNQGLSYARNAGYKKASGTYIVYVDDECILPHEWIRSANKIIKDHLPAFLGGPYYGKYLPKSSSLWFKESYGDSYILQYDLPNGPMANRYLSGGNLFIRRDVFEKIGLFNVELGMTGETINYGEEIDFQKRFLEDYPNEEIWYDQSIYLYHYIRDEKMSIIFLFKDALIRGASAVKLKEQTKEQIYTAPFLLLFFILRAFVSFINKGLLSILKKEHIFSLLYLDYKSRVWRDIGSAWYRVKLFFRL